MVSRREKILQYLFQHPGAKANDIAKTLGVTSNNIRADLSDLKKANRVFDAGTRDKDWFLEPSEQSRLASEEIPAQGGSQGPAQAKVESLRIESPQTEETDPAQAFGSTPAQAKIKPPRIESRQTQETDPAQAFGSTPAQEPAQANFEIFQVQLDNLKEAVRDLQSKRQAPAEPRKAPLTNNEVWDLLKRNHDKTGFKLLVNYIARCDIKKLDEQTILALSDGRGGFTSALVTLFYKLREAGF